MALLDIVDNRTCDTDYMIPLDTHLWMDILLAQVGCTLLHGISIFITWYFYLYYMVFLSLLHGIPTFITWYFYLYYMVFLSLLHGIPIFITWYSYLWVVVMNEVQVYAMFPHGPEGRSKLHPIKFLPHL